MAMEKAEMAMEKAEMAMHIKLLKKISEKKDRHIKEL
jgi:hypothetical protein